MPLSWADERDQDEWDRGLLTGANDPSRTDRERDYDDRLDRDDRRAEHGPLAYVERPSDRERREHADEARARNELRPRTGNVQAAPANTQCACGALETGHPHPGHRYICPRYSKHPTREAA